QARALPLSERLVQPGCRLPRGNRVRAQVRRGAKWSALAGPSPLPMPRAKPAADLHDYAAVARPGLLDGKWLVSAVWFSGEYPPKKEPDELRGDTIAFGHYQLLDRTLFIGESLKPSTVLYRASEPTEVREGIEWAFLPETAS